MSSSKPLSIPLWNNDIDLIELLILMDEHHKLGNSLKVLNYLSRHGVTNESYAPIRFTQSDEVPDYAATYYTHIRELLEKEGLDPNGEHTVYVEV